MEREDKIDLTNQNSKFAQVEFLKLYKVHEKKKKKNALYLSGNVFSTKVLTGDTIFTSPTGDRTWSTEPRESLAACRLHLIVSYFKALTIGPATGIEPVTSRSTD